MDNREAINWLTRIRDRLMTTSSKQFEALTFAIAALEQQDKAFDEWCTDCKEYDHNRHCCPRFNKVIRGALDEVKQQGWIPVTERMPEERDAGVLKKLGTDKRSDYVLATVEVKGVRMTVTACTYDGNWDWNMKYAFPDYKVIAWRPLPEPYQEEEA